MNKLRYKKIILLLIVLCMGLSLCGCNMTEISLDELMRPPQQTESRLQVQKAIESIIGTSYQFVNPSGGEYRSNINLADLDGDDKKEAICMFTIGDKKTIDVLVLTQKEDTWKKQVRLSSDATGVERLELADFNADGIMELVIGWNYLAGSDKALEIYSIGQKSPSVYKGRYSQFTITPDASGVVLVDLTAASASLLGWRGKEMITVSSVAVDSRIASVVAATLSETTLGQPAVYLDTELTDQGYHTEILVVNDGILENKLFTGEKAGVDRPIAVCCTDINADGIPEVPRCAPMEEGEGVSYYTYWSAFDGTELLEPVTTFTSPSDKFYLIYPEMWVDQVFVRLDSKVQRLYHFVDKKGDTLYSLRTFTVTEFSQTDKKEAWVVISQTAEKIIAYRESSPTPALALTTEQWASSLQIF